MRTLDSTVIGMSNNTVCQITQGPYNWGSPVFYNIIWLIKCLPFALLILNPPLKGAILFRVYVRNLRSAVITS